MRILRKYFAAENGATAIEYGLIASLLGVTIVYSLTGLGGGLGQVFGGIGQALEPTFYAAPGEEHSGGR